MIKVLILAYDFPPYVSVGGLRPFHWYKDFNQFGIEPIVVTRQWENRYGNGLDYIAPGYDDHEVMEKTEFGTIIRAPYRPNLSNRLLLKYGDKRNRLLRKIISGFYEITQYYVNVGPKSSVYHAAKNYLLTNKVDLILATGDPFVLFTYATKLSKEFDVPWIADYRDPWSHHNENSRSIVIKSWLRKLEKRTVQSAIAATTVSEFVAQKINNVLPDIEVFLVPNGYDSQIINVVQDLEQDKDCLKIAFVGTFYAWHPLDYFLALLNDFCIQHNKAIEVSFFGTNKNEWIIERVKSAYPALIDVVKTYPKIQNLELMPHLARHHVMLLFNYYSYLGTKIFDYLAIRRKILLCFTNDPIAEELRTQFFSTKEDRAGNTHLQADLLKETQGGIAVENGDEFMDILADLQDEFSRNRCISVNSVGIEEYSRTNQTKRLADFLKEKYKKHE